jgi:hypothetical protein
MTEHENDPVTSGDDEDAVLYAMRTSVPEKAALFTVLMSTSPPALVVHVKAMAYSTRVSNNPSMGSQHAETHITPDTASWNRTRILGRSCGAPAWRLLSMCEL